MTFAEQIKQIESFPYYKYAVVSSREKLVVYSIYYLQEKSIPLTFNNICIATFKLFPEKFYFSEEFKEYPHIEMLNRTILHLRPKERNYATGSVRTNYALTELGKEIASQVESDITGSKKSNIAPKKKIMDDHKKTSVNEHINITKSDVYKKWIENKEIEELLAWAYFGVTPYTQQSKIAKQLDELTAYCKSINDDKTLDFLHELKKMVL